MNLASVNQAPLNALTSIGTLHKIQFNNGKIIEQYEN